MRTLVAVFLVVHGLIHLLGVAKAFKWAELPQLTLPISQGVGVLWLGAAALFLAAAVMVYVSSRWWWVSGALAILVSFAAIGPSWADAKVGALANVAASVFVSIGFLMAGPGSLRAEYEHDLDRGLTHPVPAGSPLAEADLAPLPEPVRRYLRRVGVLGHPRVWNVRARMHGRIRQGPDDRWIVLRAEQHNFFDEPARLFYMDGSMFGLPFSGLHRFVGPSATMRVKLGGLVTIADASGGGMDQAETVTMFNDMCILAPATLVDPSIVWEAVDERTARAAFTNAGRTIRAELVFNEAGELTNFWSDDRRRRSSDGKATTAVRWSTPVTGYRAFGPFRLASRGAGQWHEPGGPYTYIDLDFDDVEYNVGRR
jgi:hypothetical protein